MSKSRAENILDLKITIMKIMKDGFNLSCIELGDLLEKYDILPFIEAGYEYFCSMGERGILLEIEEFIKEQGGVIKQ